MPTCLKYFYYLEVWSSSAISASDIVEDEAMDDHEDDLNILGQSGVKS